MSRIVDLTVTVGPETLSPPSVNKRLTLTSNYRGPGYWRASSVDMVLHTGSHVDFSLHVQEGGETAADVPLDRFCGQAMVLDMSHLEPDEPITAAAVAERAGDLRPGDIVLVRTDWTEKMWGNFPDYHRHSPYGAQKHMANLPGPYSIPNVWVDVYCVYTNRQPSSAMRGFGVTEASFAIEVQMDKIARAIGMDPWEIRLINAYRNGQMKPVRKIMEDATLVETLQAAARLVGHELSEQMLAMNSNDSH